MVRPFEPWSTTSIWENVSNTNGKREVVEDTMPRTFEHLVPFQFLGTLVAGRRHVAVKEEAN